MSNIIQTESDVLSNNVEDNDSNLKIAVCGGVDSGKSSLIGVLTHNKLDDGKGYARSLILKSKHERESGRTSNVSYNYIKYPDNKEITLIDLAGHIKYLKTTIYGITGHFLDYGMVIIGSNMGINPMTKEHMSLLLWANIPFMVVLTKEDMCPEDVYIENKKRIRKLLKIPLFSKRSIPIDTDEDFANFYHNCADETYFNSMIPIITTSCKTGKNIPKIHEIFSRLTRKHKDINPINFPKPINGISILTYIECVYQVKGVGIVITGTLGRACSDIEVGQIMYIGPYGSPTPKLLQVRIKGLHDNFRNSVQKIKAGNGFCANIKFVKESLVKNQINKGFIITSNPSTINNISMKFLAKVKILNLKTTVGIGYSPVIHYRTIRQAAKITHIYENENKNNDIDDGKKVSDIEKIIRGDNEIIAEFEFIMHPEFIELGAQLFFRDGTTKGVGDILEIR